MPNFFFASYVQSMDIIIKTQFTSITLSGWWKECSLFQAEQYKRTIHQWAAISFQDGVNTNNESNARGYRNIVSHSTSRNLKTSKNARSKVRSHCMRRLWSFSAENENMSGLHSGNFLDVLAKSTTAEFWSEHCLLEPTEIYSWPFNLTLTFHRLHPYATEELSSAA